MERRVLIVEPDSDGHHAFWLVLLILAHRRAGCAVSVIGDETNAALREQAELRGLELAKVDWHSPVAPGRGGRALVAQAADLSQRLAVERVFFAFLDNVWEGLLGLDAETGRALAGRVEGVWFHPYALDAGWRWAPPLGKRWALRGRVHRGLRAGGALAGLCRGFHFLVDEAVERLPQVAPGFWAKRLPDPYERAPKLTREEARVRFGLPDDQMIFLHIGSAEPRKGLPDVIEAFTRLAAQGGVSGAQRPLLLRVGSNKRLTGEERAGLDALVAAGAARLVESFVPAAELMEYFAACDRVLIPYRKFRYSSGILANAMGAGRSVIASDHGHIGREVGRLNAGVVFAHCSVNSLEVRLREALVEGDALRVDPPKIHPAAVDAEAFVERLAAELAGSS